MSTNLSRYFKQRRLEMGLTGGKLAGMIGYKNVGKGANRIHSFEESGELHRDLLLKLVEALDIDQDTLERLLDADYKAWSAWADEPIEPQLVLRAMACIYPYLHIPERLKTLDDLKRYAAAVARKYRKQVALIASRRQTFLFNEQGKIDRVIKASPFQCLEPSMRIGGRRLRLQCTDRGVRIQEYRKHD
jgi:hypothetical protein